MRCEVDPGHLDAVLRALTAAGVRDLVSQPPTLEELFLRHYDVETGDSLARAGSADRGSAGESERPPVVNVLAGTWALVRLALRRDRLILPVCIAVFVIVVASSTKATVALYPSERSRMVAAASVNDSPVAGRSLRPHLRRTLAGSHRHDEDGRHGDGTRRRARPAHRHQAHEDGGGERPPRAAGRDRRRALRAADRRAARRRRSQPHARRLHRARADRGGTTARRVTGVRRGLGRHRDRPSPPSPASPRSSAGAHGPPAASRRAGLGVAYLVRAFGDTRPVDGARWVSWLSPLGWGQQVRAFAGDRWWVLLILVAFALAATVVAFGSPPGGTSAAHCWPTGPVRRSPRTRWRARSRWRGVCSGVAWPPGRSPSS